MKEGGEFKGKCIIYYDFCYMGCVNGVYEVLCEVL